MTISPSPNIYDSRLTPTAKASTRIRPLSRSTETIATVKTPMETDLLEVGPIIAIVATTVMKAEATIPILATAKEAESTLANVATVMEAVATIAIAATVMEAKATIAIAAIPKEAEATIATARVVDPIQST